MPKGKGKPLQERPTQRYVIIDESGDLYYPGVTSRPIRKRVGEHRKAGKVGTLCEVGKRKSRPVAFAWERDQKPWVQGLVAPPSVTALPLRECYPMVNRLRQTDIDAIR